MNIIGKVSVFPKIPAAITRLQELAYNLWWSWGPAAQAQSLLELYESARGYDAGYLSAKLQFEASLASAEQGKAGMRPSANLSAGLSYTDQNLSANSSASAAQAAALQASNRGFQTQSLSASASQPLYRPANRAAYDQALQRAELAKAQLEAAEQELILRTSQAYFDVLAAQDNLTAVQAQRTAVAEQLAATRGPIIAATDYVKAVPESVRAHLPEGRRYLTLGTDGFGRSDTRSQLRQFFGVDAPSIARSVSRLSTKAADSSQRP